MGDNSAKLSKKRAEAEYGSNFDEKYVLIQDMLFDVVFDADSEYHVYFA